MSERPRQKQDERFIHLKFDPRFRRIQTREKREKIDDRFKSMFTDERFHLKYEVDKTGKRVKQSTNQFLQEYYELSSEEDEPGENNLSVKGKKRKSDKTTKSKIPIEESASDVDTSSTEYSSDDENEAFPWGELDQDKKQAEDATCRIAVCNLDWDQVTSKDLYVLLNSFKPADGFVKTVKIFKSEFGKKCMEEDQEKGPQFDRNIKKHFGDDDKGFQTRVASEVARDYELRKFKYYYAVVECDSTNTASKIYDECEGRELESLGLRLDLRFITDEMEFDEEPVSSTDGVNDLTTYEPTMGANASVSHFRPTCSWEVGDGQRAKIIKKAWEQENNDELDAYIASSSSNESEDEGNDTKGEDAMERYKGLFEAINEKASKSKDKQVLQFSWKTNIDEENKKSKKLKKKPVDKNEKKKKVISDESTDESSEAEMTVKQKNKKKKVLQDETEDDVDPLEKAKMKAELELLTMDNSNAHLRELLDGKPNKKMSKEEKQSFKDKNDMASFNFDATDSRFSAVFSNHLYNLDPSDQRFKKNRGAEAMLKEKWSKRSKVYKK